MAVVGAKRSGVPVANSGKTPLLRQPQRAPLATPGLFFCECPSFGPPLPYQRCDAGTPSAFNSLYVTSEILMLWTPNPVRTSAHHTSRVREVGVDGVDGPR